MLRLQGKEIYLAALEKAGFILEGRERKAVYFANRRFDRLNYAILAEDYHKT